VSNLLSKSLVIFFLISCSPASWAVQISFADFSDVLGLTLNGDASQFGSVLRLTPDELKQAGSAFLTDPIDLSNQEGSFSSNFLFHINSPGGAPDGADGLTFTLQSNSATAIGGWGGFMGYAGLAGYPQYGNAIKNSVTIEFDTFNNSGTSPSNNDVTNNTVGINVDGNWNSLAQNILPGSPLIPYYVWIDYFGLSDSLEVRINSINSKPINSLLSYTVDIPSVLGSTSAFMGFTAATGGAFANHDILTWNIETPTSVPEPTTLALLGLGLAGIGYRRYKAA